MGNVELRTFVGAEPDLGAALKVRRQVFVMEQGVPEEIEVDGLDARCFHAVVVAGDRAVGTARLREVDGWGKVERVAVLQDYRGTGLGMWLMEAVEAEAQARGLRGTKLHAQVQVVRFYERLGYVAYGEPFFEADIEHVSMRKGLR
jgi:predicted GNAT family N-acyltransferase